MKQFKDYKLCFVDSDSEYAGDDLTLYFTELDDVKEQWGDDWDDAPYEHNAGTPYESDYSKDEIKVENGAGVYTAIDILKVVVRGGYNIITPRTNQRNSQYSVEDINSGIVPWLSITDKNDKKIFIKAGSTWDEVLQALKQSCDYITIFTELRGWRD